MSDSADYSLAVGRVKTVLVIDDAFAPASVIDIDSYDISRFSEALGESRENVAEIEGILRLSALNPTKPADVNAIVTDPAHIAALWKHAYSHKEHWLNTSLFQSYREKLTGPTEELQGLWNALQGMRCQICTYYEFDESRVNVASHDVIFFDFYLKGETTYDGAISRAKRLGDAIFSARQEGKLSKYPLVVLMSSRGGAAENADKFKSETSIRGDFFRFIAKHELEAKLRGNMSGLLTHYDQNQKLAHLLDEYWIAAGRAVQTLRNTLTKVEPTELALLEEAELGVEQEKLPDYLSWLVSEYVSALLLSDPDVRSASEGVPNALAHVSFPGSVPPTSVLADVYVRSVMRLDVNDNDRQTQTHHIALGDVFARFSRAGGDPDELILVVDQSCDLARPTERKKNVLCLQSKALLLNDVAMAFYRSDGKATPDIVPIEVSGSTRYYLSSWDTLNPLVMPLAELVERKDGLQRVARFKLVRALARQEQLTQHIGRIGEEVTPPNSSAYRAQLVMNGKDADGNDAPLTFDATMEPWACAVIVQGRHLEFNQGNAPDGSNSPKAANSKPISRFSLTEQFSRWLLEKLGQIAIVPDRHFKSRIDQVTAKLNGGDLQRLDVKPIEAAQVPNEANSAPDCRRVQTQNLKLTLCFDAVPDARKLDEIIVVLRKYTP